MIGQSHNQSYHKILNNLYSFSKTCFYNMLAPCPLNHLQYRGPCFVESKYKIAKMSLQLCYHVFSHALKFLNVSFIELVLEYLSNKNEECQVNEVADGKKHLLASVAKVSSSCEMKVMYCFRKDTYIAE